MGVRILLTVLLVELRVQKGLEGFQLPLKRFSSHLTSTYAWTRPVKPVKPSEAQRPRDLSSPCSRLLADMHLPNVTATTLKSRSVHKKYWPVFKIRRAVGS